MPADDRDDGVVAEGDRDGQVLARLLGGVQVLGHVVHGDRLEGEAVAADDLDAVRADVLLAEVVRVARIAGDHGGLVEVEAAVAVVEPEQREDLEQVDVGALLGVLPPGRVLAALGCDREGVPAAGELLDLLAHGGVRGQSEGEGVVAPGAVDVHRDPGVREALDVVEVEGGGAFADASGRVGGGGQVRFGEDLFGDPQQLVLLVQGVQEAAQVVVGHGGSVREGACGAGVWAPRMSLVVCQAAGWTRASRAVRMPSQRLAAGAGRSSWSRTRVVMCVTMSSTVAGWL